MTQAANWEKMRKIKLDAYEVAQLHIKLTYVLAEVIDKFTTKNTDGELRWKTTAYPDHVLKFIQSGLQEGK
jgi:hypothetical protein